MRFKNLTPILFAYLIKFILKSILMTCRIKIEGKEHIEKAVKTSPLIIMLWHNRLAPLSEILLPLTNKLKFSAFISKSRDAEVLAQFCHTYPNAEVIRVPHNGRDKALKEMIQTLKRGKDSSETKDKTIVLITPDGPRGPVYKIKPGVLFAAQETKAKIIPFTWFSEKNRYFQLKTWDKFRFPKPFSKITATFGSPIDPAAMDNSSLQELMETFTSSK